MTWTYLFLTCEGRWAEYRGWLWANIPPEERKRVRPWNAHRYLGRAA